MIRNNYVSEESLVALLIFKYPYFETLKNKYNNSLKKNVFGINGVII